MQYSRRRNRLSSRYVYSRWMAGNFTRRFLEIYAPAILKRPGAGVLAAGVKFNSSEGYQS
jgi:hypothetical protein